MEDGVQLSDSANQEWTRRETKLGLRSAAPPALEPGPQARRLDDSWACHCQAEALYTTLNLAKPDPPSRSNTRHRCASGCHSRPLARWSKARSNFPAQPTEALKLLLANDGKRPESLQQLIRLSLQSLHMPIFAHAFFCIWGPSDPEISAILPVLRQAQGAPDPTSQQDRVSRNQAAVSSALCCILIEAAMFEASQDANSHIPAVSHRISPEQVKLCARIRGKSRPRTRPRSLQGAGF